LRRVKTKEEERGKKKEERRKRKEERGKKKEERRKRREPRRPLIVVADRGRSSKSDMRKEGRKEGKVAQPFVFSFSFLFFQGKRENNKIHPRFLKKTQQNSKNSLPPKNLIVTTPPTPSSS